MKWFKTVCIVGVALMAARLTLAQAPVGQPTGQIEASQVLDRPSDLGPAEVQGLRDRETQTLEEQVAVDALLAPAGSDGSIDRLGSRAQCEGDVDVGVDPFFNTFLFPLNGSYHYSRSMSLILRSELDPAICSPQVITHFSIYVDQAGTLSFPNIQIRMKKTTATAISTTWDGSGTLVWSGAKSFPTIGWYDFDITDFTWDTDNLLITWQDGSTSAVSGYPKFRVKNLGTGIYRQAYGYSDTGLPTTLSQTLSRTLYRLTFPAVPGACCDVATGGCTLVTAAQCTLQGGVFQGGGTTCTPNPCTPPPTGACCYPDGSCAVVTEAECVAPAIWHFDWLTCDPNPCPPPLPEGACCQPDGSCAVVTEVECAAPGIWHSDWVTCDPNPCPPPPTGACCQPATGDCAVTTEANCPSPGIWHFDWPTCDPNPCPLPPSGACCQPDGTCDVTYEVQCPLPGIWHADWPDCVTNACPVQCQGDVEVDTAPWLNNGTPLFPLNSMYDYSRSSSLILRSEVDPLICTPQLITHLALYVENPGVAYTFNNVQVRLKKTTDTETATTWDNTGALVWSGTLSFTTTGWYVLDITDFNWDADNLLVNWQYGPTAWVLNGPRFRAKWLGTGIYRQSYGYDDAGLPTAMTRTLSRAVFSLIFQGPDGACCNPATGVCSVLSAAACLTAGGEFQGPGSLCEPNPCEPCVTCPPEGVPEGEPACYDDYVDITNAGCNNPTSPVFTPIAIGETICGTAGDFLSGGNPARDTDWYEVVTNEATIFTWTVTPTFPAAIGLLQQTTPGVPGCANLTGYIAPYTLPPTCQTGIITTACMPAGTYYFFVSTAAYTGTPCGSLYVATLTGVSCVSGACCVSTPAPSCSVMLQTDCATAGGTFLGPDSVCSGLDCNGNGIDDACELAGNDCNNNGVLDACELAGNDCNGNGVLDSCDIASGTSQDCNANGVPDECELAGNDCNNNGILDWCDIGSGTSQDCNSNGVPDECDIAGGTPDCNANGVPDSCDIASGTSQDANGNGVPDECEGRKGDMNCDGLINGQDIDGFIYVLFGAPPYTQYYTWTGGGCNHLYADMNSDGAVNGQDIDAFVAVLFGG